MFLFLCRDEAEELYKKVHPHPLVYRNLYEFIMMAFLQGDTRQRNWLRLLYDWEMDYHFQKRNEVHKYLRLHIGDCKLLSKVLHALDENEKSIELLCPRIHKAILPIRNKCREWYIGNEALKKVYHYFKLILFSIKPFLSVTLLYGEYVKNFWFCIIIWTTLSDMSPNGLMQVRTLMQLFILPSSSKLHIRANR